MLLEFPHYPIISTQVDVVTIQASLQIERQTAEEARKAKTDVEARNAELTEKLEDTERKMDKLQESVQRFVLVIMNIIKNYCKTPAFYIKIFFKETKGCLALDLFRLLIFPASLLSAAASLTSAKFSSNLRAELLLILIVIFY